MSWSTGGACGPDFCSFNICWAAAAAACKASSAAPGVFGRRNLRPKGAAACWKAENQFSAFTGRPATSTSTSETRTPAFSAGRPGVTPTTEGKPKRGARICKPKGTAMTSHLKSTKSPSGRGGSVGGPAPSSLMPCDGCGSLPVPMKGLLPCSGTSVSNVSVKGIFAFCIISNQVFASTFSSATSVSTKPLRTPAASAGKPGSTSTTLGKTFACTFMPNGLFTTMTL
mmetsp:Transcript_85731/g.170177  ORF Transcript_85731/g.170177 Transcript_85731/m.170177 type:complete len:227 (-) Transcript_85731:381-1061(-)